LPRFFITPALQFVAQREAEWAENAFVGGFHEVQMVMASVGVGSASNSGA